MDGPVLRSEEEGWERARAREYPLVNTHKKTPTRRAGVFMMGYLVKSAAKDGRPFDPRDHG